MRSVYTATPAQTRSKRAGCFPPHTRTLLANREARVYARTPSKRSERKFDLFGCAYSAGRPYPLEDYEAVSAFTPPAISLAGPIIGYAVEYYDPSAGGDGQEETQVISHDLRIVGPYAGWTNIVKRHATPFARLTPPVGSLRVNRRGSIAWIACAAFDRGGYIANRAPGCIRPGNLDRVLQISAGSDEVQILDKGHEIEPDSMKLTGSRLSWRHSGRTRHATLR